ncbi:hypothetical protein ACFVS2_20350 [Brevibacillus sp. NPDC058079]|uniref:hypothetical protein n=1 Tax=Brevibacillus sp. NPDC058079 TaxID=3346330 RepID=UPI0036EAF73E
MVVNRLENEDNRDNVGRILKEKWEIEPEFSDLRFGKYHLVIWRHPEFGQLNGYVGIKRSHSYFGKERSDKRIGELNVHGGITFAGKEKGDGFRKGYWYFGFDTAHAFDYAPILEKIKEEMMRSGHPLMGEIKKITTPSSNVIQMPTRKHHYKDIEYVSNEVAYLYRQLKSIEEKNPHHSHDFRKEYKALRKQKMARNKMDTKTNLQ